MEELVFSSLVGAKLAIAAVAGSLSIGGVAAAAVGVLPGPFSHGAAVTAGDSSDPSESADPSQSADPSESPDPSESTAPTVTQTGTPQPSTGPKGPDATGPAAFGLCHAFGGTKATRKADNPSIAYRNLLAAATAAGQTVEAYCATILGTPVPTATCTATGSPDQSGDHPDQGDGNGRRPEGGHGLGHGQGSGQGRSGNGR
jgi:hypothetical protein